MAKMTERMMTLLDEVETAVFSTASPDGTPNAVPVGAKKIIDDETVLISDQFFNKTLANMQTNPQVSLTYWKGPEGYQLKGSVTIETAGPLFDETSKWIEKASERVGFPLKCKGVVLLHIEKIFGVSPGRRAGRQLV
jgi:predicted pyridoxine 5'-phosphate oxidase superfamily flavin-nucleotide-binding protein